MYCSSCRSDTAGTHYCTECGQSLGAAEGPAGSNANLTVLNDLRDRLSEIEAKLPNTNMINPRFWPRAFTVFGHNLAATAVIYGCLFVIVLFFTVVGLFAGLAGQ